MAQSERADLENLSQRKVRILKCFGYIVILGEGRESKGACAECLFLGAPVFVEDNVELAQGLRTRNRPWCSIFPGFIEGSLQATI